MSDASVHPDDVEHVTPAPANLTDDEYERTLAAILVNVEQAKTHILLGLDEDVENALTALAYNDPVRLDRMERRVQTQMRGAYDDGAVQRFNLGTYRRAAKHLQKKFAEERSRYAKLRARNLKVIEGSKGKQEALRHIPENATAKVQAWAFSTSPMLQACAWLMSQRKGRVWYDEFHNNYFTDWDGTEGDDVVATQPCTDAWMLRVYTTLLESDTSLSRMGLKVAENAVHRVAGDDVRNEPREWLTGLQWDGVERLPKWLSKVYGVGEDTYHSDVGRCWVVSLAARIMQPGCKVDTMPVLIGAQGTLKSQSLEILGGTSWYVAVNVSADKPENFLATLAGRIVAELPELDAINSQRVSKQRIKALLSTASDVYRPPYGRVAQEFKRTVVFAGTTNEIGWHTDETGGRRFWPIEVSTVRLEWLRDNREQLFAEGYERWKRGEKWWDVDRVEQERRMEEHYVEDGLLERLRGLLQTRKDLYLGPGRGVSPIGGDEAAMTMEQHWGNVITTAWVATVVLQSPLERQNSGTAKRVAHALTKLGFKTVPVRVRYPDGIRITRVWVAGPEADKWLYGDGEGELLV